MNHPDEVDDGPPRERCTFCGGDPMGFTACCPAEDVEDDDDLREFCPDDFLEPEARTYGDL